jgi:hypothetical protein
MLSALILSRPSYPAMPLAGQPGHQRSVPLNPLVLEGTLLKSPTPTADRDRPVSRRSEPSSRTAFIGEQPNPWDLLQPQDAMSRHRGAKPPRRYGRSGEISLLSPEYLLSVERRPFHQEYRRITNADFRPCSTDPSRSQAPFYVYARVARLPTWPRAPLRSSVTLWEETAPVKLPDEHGPVPGCGTVRTDISTGWYFTAGSPTAGAAGSRPPSYATQYLRPPGVNLQ